MVWTFNSGFEYLNLSDASEAEREILRNMLFQRAEEDPTKSILFRFLTPLPSFNRNESEEPLPQGYEYSPGGDEGQNSQTHQNQNIHQLGRPIGIPNGAPVGNLMSQGPGGPQQIRNFYPSGQLIPGPHIHGSASPSHPLSHAPPMSVYQPPQMGHPQMIQTPAGAYYGHPMSQQYPILHYSHATHTHNYQQYIPTEGEHSHNQSHLQQQKNPHDPTNHSPVPPGGGQKYRGKGSRLRRTEDPNINQNAYAPYYPGMGYGPVYYNPGIAQTVNNMTGPPLIMPSGTGQPQGPIFAHYPSQPPHMYANPPGTDVDQQQNSVNSTSAPAEQPLDTLTPVQSTPPQTILAPEKVSPKKEEVEVQTNVPKSVPVVEPKAPAEKIVAVAVAVAGDETVEKTKVEPEKVETVKPNPNPQPTQTELSQPQPQPTITKPLASPTIIQTPTPMTTNNKTTRGTALAEAARPMPKTMNTNTNGPTPTASASSVRMPTNSTGKTGGGSDFPELGQSIPYSTSTKPTAATAANKERSWASIASLKTANGPSNGIGLGVGVGAATPTNVNVDNGLPQNSNSNSGNDESYDAQAQAHHTMRVSPTVPSTTVTVRTSASSDPSPFLDTTIDKSVLSDENDPIALNLGEFLINYTLDHHSLSLTPRGLSNQSNYCYINATLQSLIACPPFVNLFRSMKEVIGKRPCKATPIIQSVFDFVMEFDPITRISQGRNKRPTDAFYVGANFEAAGIRRVLGLLDGATFKVEGRQEDAEEFLSHLLNGIHDEMMKVIKWYENKRDRVNTKGSNVESGNIISAATNGDASEMKEEEDQDDDQWQVMGPKNKGCMTRKTCFSKSPISEMFVGQMCSALNRTMGGQKSTTLQPFFTLQLDIQDDIVHSVRDALEGMSVKEEVSGFTSGAGQETEAWKQLSLEVLPIILILHMKRFVYDKSGNKICKLDKKVDFPVDLDIGRELLSANSKGKYTAKQRQYKLFAVVYHDGEDAHKGHYIADCFHPSGGSLWGQFGWIRYDDTAVKGITENQIQNPQTPRVPYLLYYRRVDTLSQTKKERL